MALISRSILVINKSLVLLILRPHFSRLKSFLPFSISHRSILTIIKYLKRVMDWAIFLIYFPLALSFDKLFLGSLPVRVHQSIFFFQDDELCVRMSFRIFVDRDSFVVCSHVHFAGGWSLLWVENWRGSDASFVLSGFGSDTTLSNWWLLLCLW